jgi:uncharacterized protein YbjT (DUF2867 family)
MKKVLVAGSTGYLGKYLLQECKKRGYWVRALARSPLKLDDLQEYIDDLFVAEATKPETLQSVCDDIDIIISSLGVASSRSNDTISVKDVDYGGNRNLLDRALSTSLKKFIYVSFIITPDLEHLEIAKIKKMFEKDLQDSGIDYCVIRPTAFFVDMKEMFKQAQKGTAYLIGHGLYKVNPIHGADLAKICVDAIDSNEKLLTVGGPEIYTYQEAAELAFKTLGKKPNVKKIPGWLVKLIPRLMRPLMSERRYTLIQFLVNVFQNDAVAPQYGTHTLKDYFQEIGDEK